MAPENQPNNDYAGTFQEKTVLADTRLAGWAALVQTFGIQAPVRRPSAVSGQHVKASRREEGGWDVFDKRYWPGEYFEKLGIPNLMAKKNFYELALFLPVDKIDPEIKEKLDAIVEVSDSAKPIIQTGSF